MKHQILYWQNLIDIQRVIQVLRTDEIVLGTSDTTLGLFASCTENSLRKLHYIKHRQDKPYLILIHSKKKLNLFSSIKNFQLENIINHCWPGPLTIIIPAKKEIPDFMKSNNGTIALRVPNHAGLLFALQKFDGLFSTSANVTGHPIPRTLENVAPEILTSVQFIIVDKDRQPETVPSTIIDFSGPEIKLVRQGQIPQETIESILGQKIQSH